MPTIKISYEDIRQEAKELLKELKKTNPKVKLTQTQTLIANKYDCKNLSVLRNKTDKNNGFLVMSLTDKIISNSTDLIKQLFDVEPFDDNGVPCVTIYLKGKKDTSGKTVRLDYKTIENILDNKNTILTLHQHFSIVTKEYYLNLVSILLSNKNNPLFSVDDYIFNEICASGKGTQVRSEGLYLNIVGKTGSGKSTILKELMNTFSIDKTNALIFDFSDVLRKNIFDFNGIFKDIDEFTKSFKFKWVIFDESHILLKYKDEFKKLVAILRARKVNLIFVSFDEILDDVPFIEVLNMNEY